MIFETRDIALRVDTSISWTSDQSNFHKSHINSHHFDSNTLPRRRNLPLLPVRSLSRVCLPKCSRLAPGLGQLRRGGKQNEILSDGPKSVAQSRVVRYAAKNPLLQQCWHLRQRNALSRISMTACAVTSLRPRRTPGLRQLAGRPPQKSCASVARRFLISVSTGGQI